MNSWGIPLDMETAIRERDQACVYCGIAFLKADANGGSRKRVATWEHIENDARIVTLENIALCCNSCNASKGAKELVVWLASDYCQRESISGDSVASVVQAHLV
ncbi:hypothetical protein Mal33_05670 [Rosistilla oblonga]|uniref:HNH endonuclease n=2 Tax=Rosistilla oblonga TaxID=2527990 RepID=A0A518INH3_9BACT|nr:hypothetical protein Mal33_05670 [Rosistilla oblonga]